MNATPAIQNPQSKIENPERKKALAGCFAEWREYSRSVETEIAEDELRQQVANRVLRNTAGKQTPITSWSTLTLGELKRLRRWLQEQTGSMARFRAVLIARHAVELWGGQRWDEELRRRLQERYHVSKPEDLSPSAARSLIQELKERAERIHHP